MLVVHIYVVTCLCPSDRMNDRTRIHPCFPQYFYLNKTLTLNFFIAKQYTVTTGFVVPFVWHFSCRTVFYYAFLCGFFLKFPPHCSKRFNPVQKTGLERVCLTFKLRPISHVIRWGAHVWLMTSYFCRKGQTDHATFYSVWKNTLFYKTIYVWYGSTAL